MKAYYVESGDIRKNLENLKKRAGDAPIWAVLKGNGYGLGLLPMAQIVLLRCRNTFKGRITEYEYRVPDSGKKMAHGGKWKNYPTVDKEDASCYIYKWM